MLNINLIAVGILESTALDKPKQGPRPAVSFSVNRIITQSNKNPNIRNNRGWMKVSFINTIRRFQNN